MKSTILIKDETFSGKVNASIEISTSKKTITIREIIRSRVEKEVESYNNELPDYFQGLIQPVNAERVLNGYKLRDKRKIDAEKQVYLALDAFQKNGFFVLVNNKQADSLENEIVVTNNLNISFIKLTPLVGG